jgi:hypothetical protein
MPKYKARRKYFRKLPPLMIICPRNKAPEFLNCLLIRFFFQRVRILNKEEKDERPWHDEI